MGGGRFDPTDWQGYTTSKSYSTKSTAQIFTQRIIDPELDPKGVAIRESRDSADNPQSTPVILALDVTGSMGVLADQIARQSLNTTLTEIYNRKPITDPHLMIMGIGDAEMGDTAPLQVSQFEADLRIAKQLEKLFLEGAGGGNGYESYALAWYFAAFHTATDAFEKRKRKGYLFTIGDELPTEYLRAEDIERVLGYRPEKARIDTDQLLTQVSRQWDVFHLVVEQSPTAGQLNSKAAWVAKLGEQAISLTDHTKLAEVIVSIMQVREGAHVNTVLDSWDGTTAVAVRKATEGLTKRGGAGGGALVTL